jgi:hypothetical protein
VVTAITPGRLSKSVAEMIRSLRQLRLGLCRPDDVGQDVGDAA